MKGLGAGGGSTPCSHTPLDCVFVCFVLASLIFLPRYLYIVCVWLVRRRVWERERERRHRNTQRSYPQMWWLHQTNMYPFLSLCWSALKLMAANTKMNLDTNVFLAIVLHSRLYILYLLLPHKTLERVALTRCWDIVCVCMCTSSYGGEGTAGWSERERERWLQAMGFISSWWDLISVGLDWM